MRSGKILFIFFTVMIHNLTLNASLVETPSNQEKQQIYIDSNVLNNAPLDFIEHVGPADKEFANTMAMDIQYRPIIELRQQLEKKLNLQKPLNFLRAWNQNGEAHVITITPVEYFWILKDYVDIAKINQIARELDIQSSDLAILGLGRGQAAINGKNENTYFVIVKSENLLRIRRAIYQEYLKQGGNPVAWNPENFYPHVTIGYTGDTDLHEKDGVFKDVERSLDKRFELIAY